MEIFNANFFVVTLALVGVLIIMAETRQIQQSGVPNLVLDGVPEAAGLAQRWRHL
jgi:hypothetical protein